MSPAQRKSQLLAVALQAFAQKGLSGCGHKDLAGLADVSVPTVFHYFPTRDQLVASVIEEVTRFLLEEFVQVHIVDVDEPGDTAIRLMLQAFASAIDENEDIILIWLHWSAAVKEQYWEDYQAFCDKAQRAIRILVNRGIADGSFHPQLDASSAASLVYSSANLLATMKFSGAKQKQVERVIDSLVQGLPERVSINTPAIVVGYIRKRDRMENAKHIVFLLLGVIALLTTWPYAFDWMEKGGNILNPVQFFGDAINAGGTAAFLSVDMAIAWLVFMIWVVFDTQRLGMGAKWGWFFVALSYIGVSMAFPFYLVVRERFINRVKFADDLDSI